MNVLFSDEYHLSKGVYNAYQNNNLRFLIKVKMRRKKDEIRKREEKNI